MKYLFLLLLTASLYADSFKISIHELANHVSESNHINIILDPKIDFERNFYFYTELKPAISLDAFKIILENNGFTLKVFRKIYYLTKIETNTNFDYIRFKNIPYDELKKLAVFFELELIKVSDSKVIVKYTNQDNYYNFKRFVDSVSVVKHVYLEGEIISVNETNLKDMGIDFASIASAISSTGSFDLGLFSNINNNQPVQELITARGLSNLGDISLFISLLKETGQANVVTRPNMVIMNNEKAVFKSGQKIRIVSSATDSVRQTGEYSSKQYQMLDVGLTLSCSADILDNHAVLDFIFEVSELQEYNPVLDTLITSTKSYISKFDIKNNEQIMLAGLTTSSESVYNSKVPLLGDIPLLGTLFNHDTTKREEISYLIYFKAVIK